MRNVIWAVCLLSFGVAYAQETEKKDLPPADATNLVEASKSDQLACTTDGASGEFAKMLSKSPQGENEFEQARNKEKVQQDYKAIREKVFYIDVEWEFGKYNKKLGKFPVVQHVWKNFPLTETHDNNRGYEKIVLDKPFNYPFASISLSPAEAEKYLTDNPDRKVTGRAYFKLTALHNRAKVVKELGNYVINGGCDYSGSLMGVEFNTPDKGTIFKHY